LAGLVFNLDLVLSFLPDPLSWERDVAERLRQSAGGVGFVAAWEVQSQLATLVLVGLVATVPLAPALIVMLGWSFVACAVYCYSRRRGMPDLLEAHAARAAQEPRHVWALKAAFLTAVKAWLAGLQPFVYSRTVCQVLSMPSQCRRIRLARGVVLFVGLTLFGVTAAHHMLRRAGYSEDRIFKLTLAGSCLNVPYRLLLSATAINLFTGFAPLPV
jgi:hypothetical protein